jgi:hypothetical protein
MKKLFLSNQKCQKQEVIKMRLVKWSPFFKLLSWILVFALLNVTSGCRNYFKVTKSVGSHEAHIENFYDQNKKLIIHLDDEAWILEMPEVVDGKLVAFAKKKHISKLTKPVVSNKPNRFILKDPHNQYDVLNEVHIYTSEFSRISEDKISIPISSIQKIDIYDFDKSATSGSAVLGAIGGAVLVWGGFFLILMLTSCPFIYTFDGHDYLLAGEIYSGSIQKQLERHDFLKLQLADSEQLEYEIKIVNELQEIQHTNLLELWVFDHNNSTKIGIDKYGKPYELANLLSPKFASNLAGIDVTEMINKQDNQFYTSNEFVGELPLTDGVILEFPNPGTAKNASLSINAKNTLLLDYMIGQFYNQFGNLYGKWTKKQQKVPAEQLRDWTLSQNIPLSLAVERNGNWEKVDYYNIAGPVKMKEDILSFPLNGAESDPLRIKLEFGNFFWEVDYAGINYSNEKEIAYQIVQIKTAIDKNGKDVSKKLKQDDRKYYIQPNVGDEAIVNFELPLLTAEKRTIFLHSKGWYQILRDPSGTPDRDYLETFRESGRFNLFVNDFVQSYTDNPKSE